MLAAAEEILLSDGVDMVTPATVTKRAGLARSTFYEYFPSKDDLLVALARVAFHQWREELDAAMAAIPDGTERLRAYVRMSLRLSADGRHQLATALRGVPLSPRSHDDIAELHESLNIPLRSALHGLISPDDRYAAALIHGAIGAAMNLVKAGRPVDDVAERTAKILIDGLG